MIEGRIRFRLTCDSCGLRSTPLDIYPSHAAVKKYYTSLGWSFTETGDHCSSCTTISSKS